MRKPIKSIYLRIYDPVVLAALNHIRTTSKDGEIVQAHIAIESAIVSHACRNGFDRKTAKSLGYAPAEPKETKEIK